MGIDHRHIEWHVYEDLVVAVYNGVVFAEHYKPYRLRWLRRIELSYAKWTLHKCIKHLHSRHWIESKTNML
jgi:hypothetical protein